VFIFKQYKDFRHEGSTLFSSFSVVLCFLAAAAPDARGTTAPASTEVPIVNSNKTAEVTYPSAVRAKMRERYGDSAPLNEPVISPVAMFRSNLLVTVAEQ